MILCGDCVGDTDVAELSGRESWIETEGTASFSMMENRRPYPCNLCIRHHE